MGLYKKLADRFENYKHNFVCKQGRHIATLANIEASKIDKATEQSSKQSGHKIAWYYFGGYAVLKTFGNIDTAQYYLKMNLDSLVIKEELYCRFE